MRRTYELAQVIVVLPTGERGQSLKAWVPFQTWTACAG